MQDEIREVAAKLPSKCRSALLRASETLVELRASERRRALGIIKELAGDGRLDYRWVTSFLAVLRRLKDEEDHFF